MSNEKKMLKDEKLENVSGGAIRPKYVSSFFCEKCGKTIHLNGVCIQERAKEEHERKEHSGKKK